MIMSTTQRRVTDYLASQTDQRRADLGTPPRRSRRCAVVG